MKTMSIVGIVVCAIGLIGSLMWIVDDPSTAVIGGLVYGYFMAFSIMVLGRK